MKLNEPVSAAAFSPAIWLSAIFSAAFLTVISPLIAATEVSANRSNAAEQWVVAQLKARKKANLNEQFPDKEKDKRKLRANFLEELLTGALPRVKPRRYGIYIAWAIIDEPIDLENAQIDCRVGLRHCQFNEGITLSGANFASSVLFDESTFKAEANFRGVKVGSSAFFRGAVFERPVDFASADIAGEFAAEEAKFLNTGEASFNGMKVGGSALFHDAVFKGPVDFSSADISGEFGAARAEFQNNEREVSFNAMNVRSLAFFHDAVFKGPVADESFANASTRARGQAQSRGGVFPYNLHARVRSV